MEPLCRRVDRKIDRCSTPCLGVVLDPASLDGPRNSTATLYKKGHFVIQLIGPTADVAADSYPKTLINLLDISPKRIANVSRMLRSME